MEMVSTPTDENAEPVEAVRRLTLCRCEIKVGRIRTTGTPEVLTLQEAMTRLAPSNTRRAKMNVINARVGWYIGLREQDPGKPPSNFLFQNPTRGGDIRWILQEMPDFEEVVLDVYYVKDVEIPNGIEGEPVVQRGRPRA